MGWPKGKAQPPRRSGGYRANSDTERAYYRNYQRQLRRRRGHSVRMPYGPPAPLRADPGETISMTWPEYLHCQCWYHGRLIKLRRLHADLLLVLLLNRGRTLSRNELIERLWPDPNLEPEFAEEALRVQMMWLRRVVPGLIQSIGRLAPEGRAALQGGRGFIGWMIPR